jgi:hypothetical protein
MATGVRQSVPVPRTVEPADIPIIIDNIRREEFAQEHSPETLERIFRYEWLKSKPNLGFVLTVGKRIVAFQALVYSERLVRGETRKFASRVSFGTQSAAWRLSHIGCAGDRIDHHDRSHAVCFYAEAGNGTRADGGGI